MQRRGKMEIIYFGVVVNCDRVTLALRLYTFFLLCVAMDIESNPGPIELCSAKNSEPEKGTAQTILKELCELRGSTEASAAKINKKIDDLSGELNKLKQDVKDAKEETAAEKKCKTSEKRLINCDVRLIN